MDSTLTLYELAEVMAQEVEDDRQRMRKHGYSEDAIYHRVASRGLIAVTQLDFFRYVTHDPKISPECRLHGSPEEKKSSFGHLILQMVAVGVASGLSPQDCEEGVESALAALAESDWKARAGVQDRVVGMQASLGANFESAVVWQEGEPRPDEPGPYIMVARHPSPGTMTLLRFNETAVLVTDEGGISCHAAIVAREHGIPCIVGTGTATKLMQHGSRWKLIQKQIIGSEAELVPM